MPRGIHDLMQQMDVWSPDHQADPLERRKRLNGGKGVLINHRRHPGRSKEISAFLLTFLIMDVPFFTFSFSLFLLYRSVQVNVFVPEAL
jgi:hypothetical protein